VLILEDNLEILVMDKKLITAEKVFSFYPISGRKRVSLKKDLHLNATLLHLQRLENDKNCKLSSPCPI